MASSIPQQLQIVKMTVKKEHVLAYAEVVDDFNPIHVDEEFAKASPIGGVIAHGTMSLALIWQSLEKSLDQAQMAKTSLDIRFVRPVRLGDTISASGIQTSNTAFDVYVENQTGERVIEGTATL